MSQWETLKIEEKAWKEKAGLFSKKWVYQYKAITETPTGPKSIAKSKITKYWGHGREELVKQLAMDGWEPVTMDTHGIVTVMRRPIQESTSHTTTNSVDLLQQLANLRAADILTEQEFQTKKAEILKRM